MEINHLSPQGVSSSSYASAGLQFNRPISLWRTSYAHISMSRGNLPDPVGAITWIAQYAPHHRFKFKNLQIFFAKKKLLFFFHLFSIFFHSIFVFSFSDSVFVPIYAAAKQVIYVSYNCHI